MAVETILNYIRETQCLYNRFTVLNLYYGTFFYNNTSNVSILVNTKVSVK